YTDEAEPYRCINRRKDCWGSDAAASDPIALQLGIRSDEIAVFFAAVMQVLMDQKVQQRHDVGVLKRLPPRRAFQQILREGHKLPINFDVHRECALFRKSSQSVSATGGTCTSTVSPSRLSRCANSYAAACPTKFESLSAKTCSRNRPRGGTNDLMP